MGTNRRLVGIYWAHCLVIYAEKALIIGGTHATNFPRFHLADCEDFPVGLRSASRQPIFKQPTNVFFGAITPPDTKPVLSYLPERGYPNCPTHGIVVARRGYYSMNILVVLHDTGRSDADTVLFALATRVLLLQEIS